MFIAVCAHGKSFTFRSAYNQFDGINGYIYLLHIRYWQFRFCANVALSRKDWCVFRHYLRKCNDRNGGGVVVILESPKLGYSFNIWHLHRIFTDIPSNKSTYSFQQDFLLSMFCCWPIVEYWWPLTMRVIREQTFRSINTHRSCQSSFPSFLLTLLPASNCDEIHLVNGIGRYFKYTSFIAQDHICYIPLTKSEQFMWKISTTTTEKKTFCYDIAWMGNAHCTRMYSIWRSGRKPLLLLQNSYASFAVVRLTGRNSGNKSIDKFMKNESDPMIALIMILINGALCMCSSERWREREREKDRVGAFAFSNR